MRHETADQFEACTDPGCNDPVCSGFAARSAARLDAREARDACWHAMARADLAEMLGAFLAGLDRGHWEPTLAACVRTSPPCCGLGVYSDPVQP